MKSGTYSKEEQEFIKKYYEKYSIIEIARLLNRKAQSVTCYCLRKRKELGICNVKRRIFTEEDKKFIIENYLTMSNGQIAQKLGRTKEVICAFLSEHNLKRPEKVKINDQFGKLTVIEKYPKKHKKRGYSNYWKCKCICGNESKVSTNTLISGHSSSCGCGRIDAISANFGLISGTWYGQNIKSAKVRGLEFNVSKEYLDKILKKQKSKCALTGWSIGIKLGRQSTKTTASLDRIDNTKGYIEGNVWFVHKDINRLKWIWDLEYLIKMCADITNFYIKDTNEHSTKHITSSNKT